MAGSKSSCLCSRIKRRVSAGLVMSWFFLAWSCVSSSQSDISNDGSSVSKEEPQAAPPIPFEGSCQELSNSRIVIQSEMGERTSILSILPLDAACHDQAQAIYQEEREAFKVLGTYEQYVVLYLMDYGSSVVIIDTHSGKQVASYEEKIWMVHDVKVQEPTLKGEALTIPNIDLSGKTVCENLKSLTQCARVQADALSIDTSNISNVRCGPKVRAYLKENKLDEVQLDADIIVRLSSMKAEANRVGCYISSW